MSTEPLRPANDGARTALRQARRRQLRRRRIAALAVLVLAILLVPPAISYGLYMSKPSSVPWKVRSVEWVRDNHGAWLVNTAERIYYSQKAPKKGGPALAALPTVAGDPRSPQSRASSSAKPPYAPPAVKPAITPALPHEGVWTPAGRTVHGAHPVMVTVFRNERD
jgi:hypothetical protein